MKIKEKIMFGSILTILFLSAASAEETALPSVQLEQFVQTLKMEESVKPTTTTTHWRALSDFQASLWRAMALDPAPFVLVPLSQVPKNLFAAELNQELGHQWSELKNNSLAKDFGAQTEFDQYAKTVDEILALRNVRKFPPARAIAKRGTLDQEYQALAEKVQKGGVADPASSGHLISETQFQKLHGITQAVKEQVVQIKSQDKKNVFAEGSRFIWFAFVALCAFALGVAAYRFNPDFFQQYLDSTVSSKPIQAQTKLDYVTWLKDFEDALQRLKASQIIHERRIEELVVNSEKIHQHALSLHTDARIKNEANLEHRMATLIKEIHQQIDQAKKLKSADRVQIQGMLEQSLMLCDAVENQSILVDSSRLNEPDSIYKNAN